MSSTNRGRERQQDDFYQTPHWATEVLIDNLKLRNRLEEPILEPSVGMGNIKEVLNNYGYNDITGIDINEEFNPDIVADYLSWNPDRKYCTIITNPPYSQALEFIKKSLNDNPYGLNVFLLRLNFLESRARYEFWKTNMPSDIYVLAERPKFYLNKTDSIAYAWFVWEPHKGDTSISVISKSDLDE